MSPLHPLPRRLHEVFLLLAEGLNHDVIALKLSLSKSTVDTYAQRIKMHFGEQPELRDPRIPADKALVLIGQRYKEQITVPADPQRLGRRLIERSFELAHQYKWEEEIATLREAEETFGPASTVAAQAACYIAQTYLELGNYTYAWEEVTRASTQYAAIMDPATRAELYKGKGWIAYEQGRLREAAKWLQRGVELMHQTGTAYLGQGSLHFLGRVYTDIGRSARRQRDAAIWFHKARGALDEALTLHKTLGNDWDQAYDLFRTSQLLLAQGKWKDAADLRDRARNLFGTTTAVVQIDVEEAKLALENSENFAHIQEKVTHALHVWSNIKYAPGLAQALQILGRVRHLEGKREQALEHYIAAWCIYPPDTPDNRRLLVIIEQLLKSLDFSAQQRLLHRLCRSAESHSHAFVYLASVPVDRSADITALFTTLAQPGQ